MEEFLNMLNPEQRAAVEHEGENLLILAGAGSGKTRVITTKIAYLINQKNVNPLSILAVTFTKKAANEMKERAVLMEPLAEKCQIKTFHSFGAWFLRRYAEAAGLDPNFTVYDDDDSLTLLKNACPELSPKDAKKACREIALCKDYFLTPDDDLSQIESDFDLEPIYRKYQQRLHSTGNADFGDLIMLPAIVMKRNPEIRDYIHRRFQVIMVDEYQDSNIAQYKLLVELSGVEQNCGNYVCVVGDGDQSIYAFRGAKVQNILNFPNQFPNTDIIRLERNYRSTSKILDAASLIVSHNEGRLGKTLISERGEGAEPVLAFLPTQDSEAAFVADLISKSVDLNRSKFLDWAITYRTNAQSLEFEKEFLHRKIPYKIVGSLKFYEREEVKDAIAYVSLVANPRDEISFRRVVNKPGKEGNETRGIGAKSQSIIVQTAIDKISAADFQVDSEELNFLETAKECAESFSKKAKEGVSDFCKIMEDLKKSFNPDENLSKFMQTVIDISGLGEYYEERDKVEKSQRMQNLMELVNSAVFYDCTMEGLNAFLDAINLDRSLEVEDENESLSDFVTLITLHNTKGLEFQNVIITGVEEGVFPRTDKVGFDLEEERRLFYVGITRAMNELYVTSCAQRRMYGRTEFMRPSPFLYEGREAFRVIGNAPYKFVGGSESSARAENSGEGNFGASRFGDKAELAEKWKRGTKIYNDENGYGVISECFLNEGEYVIKVNYETGAEKKYLPEYQSSKLTIIKDF